MKNEKKANNNDNSLFLLLFYIEKLMFCLKRSLETYLEKLSLYCYICITFFSRDMLFQMQ